MHKRIFGITALMLLAGVFTAGSLGLVPFTAFAQEQVEVSAPPQESLSVSHERLENLGELKQQVKKYYACTCDCGCYKQEAEAQGARAIEFLRQRAAKAGAGEKLALVMDVDETALSNYPLYLSSDFGYMPKLFDEWVATAKAPANPAALAIFKAARELGVAVFFLTGRREDQRAATAHNLRAVGYQGWASMTLRRPADMKKTAFAYKTEARRKIIAAGYHLVLNVGDQLSDLKGEPAAEFSVKLPNPMYFLP